MITCSHVPCIYLELRIRADWFTEKQMFITHGAGEFIYLFILHNGMHLHTDGKVLPRPMKISPLWPLKCLMGTSKHT